MIPFFSEAKSKLFGAGLILTGLVTLGLAIGLMATRAKLADARETIASLIDWQTGIVDATRIAADNPKVTKETAQSQIQQLGVVRVQLRQAVDDQNDAIEAFAAETEAAKAVAAKARKERAGAIRRAEQLQRELRARARVPVAPEQVEETVREIQDELYESGI